MKAIKEFKKTKDLLICIDSDGCVLDTMEIKPALFWAMSCA